GDRRTLGAAERTRSAAERLDASLMDASAHARRRAHPAATASHRSAERPAAASATPSSPSEPAASTPAAAATASLLRRRERRHEHANQGNGERAGDPGHGTALSETAFRNLSPRNGPVARREGAPPCSLGVQPEGQSLQPSQFIPAWAEFVGKPDVPEGVL